MSLHLTENKAISRKMRKQLKHNSVHLFATRREKQSHDWAQLAEDNDEDHPVAAIKSVISGHCCCQGGKIRAKRGDKKKDKGRDANNNCFHEENVPNGMQICIGALVCSKGRNFMPCWGLFNNSIGQVKEIVYRDGESPLNKNMPLYVLVEFFSYSGPALFTDVDKKKWAPVPRVQSHCINGGGSMTYIPLMLSYGRTIHAAQGLSIGPVNDGQEENMIKGIIVTLGTQKFEGINPGLTYTAVSRATTIGDPDDIMSSAIYFEGAEMNVERLRRMNTNNEGKSVKRAMRAR